jgi:hypothetical protein
MKLNGPLRELAYGAPDEQPRVVVYSGITD